MAKEARAYNEVKADDSISGIGKCGHIHAKKNETRPPSYTT